MRTMNRTFPVIAAILMGLLIEGKAQSVPTVFWTPKKYWDAPDGQILENSKKVDVEEKLWIVFSDRNDNKVYENPGDLSPVKTAAFLQPFYVTGETDEYLELYKYDPDIRLDNKGKRNQLNPKKAIRIGWMKKENLLLWFVCQKNSKGFSEKAMTVVKIENLADIKSLTKNNQEGVRIFGNPYLQTENNNSVRMFDFLYVYKKIGRSVLIGKINKSRPDRIDKDVLGWVDENVLIAWPDRVCLQPNYDADAAAERKRLGIKSSLFEEKKDVEDWNGSTDKPKPFWNSDTYEVPWKGSKKRFPIFGTTDNVISTGFVTNVYREGAEIASSDDQALVTDNLSQVVKEKRKINMVFVIDAGVGMDRYANAVINSLQQLIKKREDMNSYGDRMNTYKYGAVTYRSIDDKACPSGNLAITRQELTLDNNGDKTIRFIRNEFARKGCSDNPNNKEVNGALDEALQMIRKADPQAQQSNCIIFIGGATGNKESFSKTAPDIIAKQEVNLSVFQVENIEEPVEYDNFYFNFKDLFNEAIKRKWANTDKDFSNNKYATPNWWKDDKLVYNGLNQNVYRSDYPGTSPLMINISFPEKGDAFSPVLIDQVLDSTFSFFERKIENANNDAITRMSGVGEKKIEKLDATVWSLIEKTAKKTGNKNLVLNLANNKNLQFFVPAFTKLQVERCNSPLFKFVLYVNEDELLDMRQEFEKLVSGQGSSSEMRQSLYDAYQAMVDTYFGKDKGVSAQMKTKKSMSDVIAQITGLPSKSELMQKINVDEINDVGKVSDEEIDEVIKLVQNSVDNLKNLTADNNGSLREVRDGVGVFYWVPQEYLP